VFGSENRFTDVFTGTELNGLGNATPRAFRCISHLFAYYSLENLRKSYATVALLVKRPV
jgi:hypothetical protein